MDSDGDCELIESAGDVSVLDGDDSKVLEEMEMAAAHERLTKLREDDGLSEMSDEVKFHLLHLPEIMRLSAIDAFKAHKAVLNQLRSMRELTTAEYELYADPKSNVYRALNPIESTYLAGKYYNSFRKTRSNCVSRRNKKFREIKKYEARIAYLEQELLCESGLPKPLEMCDLCRLSGEVTMVTPYDRPLCSNKLCKFVLCDKCLRSFDNDLNTRSRCPGCRSEYVLARNANSVFNIRRHVELDSFVMPITKLKETSESEEIE